MKYLILVLAILCSAGGVGRLNAQALRVTPDTVIYTASLNGYNTSSSGVAQFCGIVNNSGQSDTVCWKIALLTMNPNWQSMSLCDPNECYLFYGDVTNGTTHQFALAADSGASVDVTSTPQCVADTGYMQALFWLKHDSAASATNLVYIPIYTGSCATAIASVAPSAIRVYPSPVSSNMTVSGLSAYSNLKLTVYDMLGNVALQKFVSQPGEAANVNTDQLREGVYILTVENEGTRLLTKRIEKLD